MLQYCDTIAQTRVSLPTVQKKIPALNIEDFVMWFNVTQSLQVDTFIVEAVDLGRLENIIIGHDGKGEESAWFLEKVSVKEGADAKHKYIFTYGR